MTRRLRIAGTAFGALLVPACASFQPDATVMHPPVPGSQPVGHKPPAGAVPGPSQAARPRVVEKFAEGRTDEPPAIADKKPAPPAPAPAPTGPGIEQTRHSAPAEPVARIDPPRLSIPGIEPIKPGPMPEPTPDADGVIRSPLPVIKGVTAPPVEPAAPGPFKDEPKLTLPTPGEPPPPVTRPVTRPAATAEPGAVLAPPPPGLPPGVIGSSVQGHQSNASPIVAASATEIVAPPDLPPAATTVDRPSPPADRPVLPAGGDLPLVKAVRAFQENRPEEAVEHLKAYDPATQQILLSLLPPLARLGDGKLQQMKPEEMDVLLDQVNRVPFMLRPRASLQATNVRLCREVHNFAHVEPFPDRHEFRPGDIVYLYMELANFSCTADPRGGYTVTLGSSLELKDAAGAVVWRADPKEVPDKVSTPPQDYYRNFRLSIPNVPAGTYSLAVQTTDRPTDRQVQKSIEVRIGSR